MKLNPLRWFEKTDPRPPRTKDSRVVGQKITYFDASKKNLAKNRLIYNEGGVVSEAVDCHALFMFSNDYRFEGDENLVERMMDEHDAFGFEAIAHKLITDSLVVEKGIAEIAPSVDGSIPVKALYYRPGEQFTEIYDERTTEIVGYKQTLTAAGIQKTYMVDPADLLRIDLGLPLLTRCKDDIERHTKIVDAVSESIFRHGFPRYVVEIGQPGEQVPDTVLTDNAGKFEELKPNHEWVTPAGVKVSNIDTLGITNTKLYVDFAVQELCAALGTPEEMLGLGRGSTEATANVRLDAWYDRIATLQKRFASQWNKQIVDRILEGWGAKPGSVWLVFGDPSPTDDMIRAQMVATLLTASPLDPVITIDEARGMLGLAPLEEPIKKPEPKDQTDTGE